MNVCHVSALLHDFPPIVRLFLSLSGEVSSYGSRAQAQFLQGYKMYFPAMPNVPALIVGRGTRCTFQLRPMYPPSGTGTQVRLFTFSCREGACAPVPRRTRPATPSHRKLDSLYTVMTPQDAPSGECLCRGVHACTPHRALRREISSFTLDCRSVDRWRRRGTQGGR